MNEARHDLGRARLLKPEALGVPGKRTFRFQMEAERGSAYVWMEKDQLSSLAIAIKKFLEENGGTGRQAREPVIEGLPEPFFDFKAASLGLAFDETSGLFAVLAYNREDFEEDRATLLCWLSRRQVERMADEALVVVAAGRSTCPLCKEPMDSDGHMCVKTNGHHKTGIEEM